MPQRQTSISRARPHVISDEKQLKALVNPVRQRIFDALNSFGSASVSEIAEELGLPADVVNYHVRTLEGVRLVKHLETRETTRRAERVFALARPGAIVLFDPYNAKNVSILTRAVGSLLNILFKDFANAFRPEFAITTGLKQNLRASRMTAWLTDSEWAQINALIKKIMTIMNNGQRRHDVSQSLYSVAILTAPIRAKPLVRKISASQIIALNE